MSPVEPKPCGRSGPCTALFETRARRRRCLWSCVAAASTWLAVQACGGSSATPEPGDAASDSQLRAACEAQCDLVSACRGESPSEEPCSECVDDPPLTGVFRYDFVQNLQACIERLTCDDDVDTCVDQAIDAVPDAAASPVYTRCLGMQDECTDIGDDSCKLAIAFTDAGRERIDACLDAGCAGVAACLGAIGSRGP